jgi:SAM-dependent methyltransferase
VRWSLVVAFVVSAVAHLVPILSDLRMPMREPEVRRKPLSVKFVPRPPRLVKPMELIKRPLVVQRQLLRRVTIARTFQPRSMRTAALHGGTVLASLARPSQPVDRSLLSPTRLEFGPDIAPPEVKASKESAVRALREDLMAASDLDYGRYGGFAVQDPKNKKDIKGFIKLALIRYKTNFRDFGGEPDWNTSPAALRYIAEYLSRHTGIQADYKYIFTLDSEELIRQKIPLIFMQGHATFEVTEAEVKNLGRYLRDGGFLLIDDSRFLVGGPFDRAAREMVKRALGPDVVFEKIPNDHWLYHSYYDFDGPPAGDDVVSMWDRPTGSKTIYEYLEAVYYNGRMVVLMSNKSYNNAWNYDPHWRTGGNTRQLQFAVNIVVFVLTQPGGYAQQVLYD